MKPLATRSIRRSARACLAGALVAICGCAGIDRPRYVPSTLKLTNGPTIELFRGDSTHLVAVVPDHAGHDSTAIASWVTSDESVATISSAGELTAQHAGIATVTALAGTLTASLSLTVLPRMAVTSHDSLGAAGELFEVRGFDLAATTVTVDSIPVTLAVETDTQLVARLPSGGEMPCVPAGHRFRFQLSGRNGSASFDVPATELDLVSPQEVGQYAIYTTELARGCALTMPNSGTYLIAAYSVEGGPQSLGDTITVTVPYADATPNAAGASAAFRWPRGAGESTSDAIWSDRDPRRGSEATRAAAATLLRGCGANAPGDSIYVPSARNANGKLVGVGAAAPTDEPWIMVGANADLFVYFDTATVALAAGDSEYAAYVNDLLEAWTTYDRPLIQKLTRGLPDKDLNGHVDVLISHQYGSPITTAFAAIDGFRDGCANGEGVWLPIPGAYGTVVPQPPFQLHGGVVSTLLHEATHLTDLGWPDQLAVARPTVELVEGFPTFVQAMLGTAQDDAFLGANFVRQGILHVHGSGGGTACVWPQRTYLVEVNSYSGAVYSGGCFAFSWLFAWDAARRHASAVDVLPHWSDPQLRWSQTSMAGFMARFLGDTAAPWRPWGQMLLSWAADDRVPNAPPEISNGVWNTPAVLTDPIYYPPAALAFLPPIPDYRLSRGPAPFVFRIGAPDVRFLEVDAMDGAKWQFLSSIVRGQSKTAPPPTFAVAILRTR